MMSKEYVGNTVIAGYMKDLAFCGCIFRQFGWEGVGFVSIDIAEMLASYLFTYATCLMCYSRP